MKLRMRKIIEFGHPTQDRLVVLLQDFSYHNYVVKTLDKSNGIVKGKEPLIFHWSLTPGLDNVIQVQLRKAVEAFNQRVLEELQEYPETQLMEEY